MKLMTQDTLNSFSGCTTILGGAGDGGGGADVEDEDETATVDFPSLSSRISTNRRLKKSAAPAICVAGLRPKTILPVVSEAFSSGRTFLSGSVTVMVGAPLDLLSLCSISAGNV